MPSGRFDVTSGIGMFSKRNYSRLVVDVSLSELSRPYLYLVTWGYGGSQLPIARNQQGKLQHRRVVKLYLNLINL